MSVIPPKISARLRRMLGRFVGPAGAMLFSLVLASCAGGGFGGASDTPAVNPVFQPAPVASGPISPASQRNVAEALSGLKLGDETPPISPENIAVSDNAEILNRNPFLSPSPAARASGWGARADSTRKTPGYKAFEVAVPSENPLMTVAVWISETPPDYPEGKPEQDPEADRKFLYLRLQVFIAVGHVALIEGGGVEVLESQVIVVEEKRPDPKPQPKPQPVTLEAVTAETVCESGSLSANGLTQAQLDYEFLGAVLENDLEGACEYLRRGANIEIREDEVGRPYNLSALMIAAGRGGYNYPDMTRLLLANGAKTDARDGSGWVTALHYAAASGHTETAALLLDWGGDVNVLSSTGDPPLYQAAHWGRADMVQLLLSRGADPDIQADTGVAPLHGAASNVARSGSAAVVSLLLSYGADPNPPRSRSNPGLITRAGETGHSPLDDLVARGYGGYAEAARILRDAGGKCFVRTSPLCGAVHVAVDFSSSGAGTVSAEGDDGALAVGGEVRQGATVMFTATPAAGHYVSGWSGNCAEVGEVADGLDGTAKFCAVSADSDLSVHAEFSEIPSLAGPLCESGSLSANGLTQAQLDAGLISAAEGNDLAGACEYLRRGANVDARESGRYYKRTALMIATTDGRLELAKLLYANGADVNLDGGNHNGYDVGRGWTALQYSGAAGRPELAGWLLDSGAELNSEWESGKTALWEAAYWGRPDVVELLLSRGAETETYYNGGATPLHAAVLLDEWVSARVYWANGPAFRYKRNAISYSYPIPTANEHGQVVSLLLSHDADVNARYQSRSPLDYAARQGDERLSAMLRDAGGICYVETGPLCGVANVATAVTLVVTAETVCESGSHSANGQTQAQLDAGLISAADGNDLSEACEYLRRGANVNARESGRYYKRTALMIAANDGRLELAKLLRANGADVNLHGGNHDGGRAVPGWSALHYAAAAGHAEMAGWLLDAGAGLETTWDGYKTALWEAAYWGRPEVAAALLSRGADSRNQDGGSVSALRMAVYDGSPGWRTSSWSYRRMAISYSYPKPSEDALASVISLLAAGGADVNERRQNRSVLDDAVSRNRARFAEVLREFGGKCVAETGPLCGVADVATAVTTAVTLVVTAETVCESGSLSANGQTQAELDAGLISAAKANNLANACEYLRRGASPDSRESRGVFNRTALMIAASDGRLDLAKLLHANGADVNLQKGQMNHWAYASPGWSALIYAATAGHADMVSWLLDSGADIEAYWHSPGKKTALWEAAHWGRADVIGILLSHGADPDRSDASDAFPLHGGADKLWGGAATPSNVVMVGYSRMGEDAQVKVVSLLAAAVSDVNALENGRTALDAAVSVNHAEVAAVLRNAGGRCVVETGPLCPVVEVATAETVTVTAETVCESGSLSANGQTQAQLDAGLLSAAKANDLAKVCEHLRRGADMGARDRFQAHDGVHRRTPLMLAAVDNRLELAKLLVGNGASVNYQSGGPDLERQDGAGWSALMYAAGAGQVETATYLLDQGAEINMQWASGYSSLHEAAIWGRYETVELLIARGANVNVRDYGVGETPLHGASWGGDRGHFTSTRPSSRVSWEKVIKALLDGGADVNARVDLDNPSGSRAGRSPLDTAALHYMSRRAAKLRDAGGYCYVQTSSLCAYPPVVTAVTLAVTTAVTSETVCESGSLSANGLTQAQLDAGLISAAKANDLAKVCEHLRRGADMNARDRFQAPDGLHRRTPLMLAAVDNRLELAKLLVGNGASVNYQSGGPDLERQDGAGWSALMYAAGAGQVETATYLLDQGAEINMQWASGYSSLHEAAIWGRYETVELLIARGANVNVRDYGVGETPLHGASWGGSRGHFTSTRPSSRVSWEKVIKALLDGGADVNARVDLDNPSGSRAGRSPLDTVALHYMSRRAAKLRDAGGYCYVQTSSLCAYPPVAEADSLECPAGTLPTNGLTAAELNMTLRMAARGGDAARACEALRRGAEVNDNLDDSEFTPLQEAVSGGHLEAAKVLLANGAEVNKRKGGAGHSPLDLAARDGEAEIAALLRNADGRCFLETGPLCQSVPMATPGPVTVVNTVAATVVATVANTVIAAVENTVAATVAAGSCPAGTLPTNGMTQAQLDDGFLGAALENDAEEVCEYLRRGASMEIREDDTGRTALMIAGRYNYADLARLLLSNGAEVDYGSGTGWVALHFASGAGQADVAKVLLDGGGDVNVLSSGGDPPLYQAAHWGRADMVQLLLSRGADPDIQANTGVTPLHGAASNVARSGSAAVVSLLLSYDADPNLRRSLPNPGLITRAGETGHSPLDDLVARGYGSYAEAARILRDGGGKCFVRTSSLCQNVPVATSDPVTVVNTVAATVANTIVATVANTAVAAVENTVASTVAAGSCPAGTLDADGMTQAQLDYEFLGAVLENDLEEVCNYLRRGANIEIRTDQVGRPHHRSEESATALMIAGRNNYSDLARLLLSNGADVDSTGGLAGGGWAALHIAAYEDHADVARVLLDGGGDVNVLSSGGDPPLYQAAHWGRADMVKLLLSRGADPDIQANTGVTPLHGAASNVAQSGSAAVVSLLLSYDADPNLRRSLPSAGLITRAGETGHSPLDDFVARGYGSYAEAARILRDGGGKCFVRTSSLCQNVPVATSDPVTVVNTVAATVANTIVATVANTAVAAVENTVASTVAAGSCPAGTLDADGMTQAQLDYEFLGAVLENDLEEVCNYLRRGANIEIRTDQVGRPHHRSEESATALMIAGRNNYSDLARLLLSNGADVDSTGGLAGGGWAALHIAAYEDHADVARVLLDGGADPDVDVDFDHFSSWTPLHEAAYYNNWRIMKILLTSGANSNIQTTRPGRRGGAPLHYVFDGTRSGSALAVSVLVAGDADVNLRDSGGNSALDLAANRGDAASAEILRAAGGQCFVSTSSLCGSAPAPAASAEFAPATDRLRESFAGAFNPSPAFGDAFGAVSGSSERFLGRLDSLMRSSSGSGGNGWDSFAGWQRENEHGRMWFSTGQRGDFGFGAGVGGAGGDLSASPFAAMVGNGMLAGGETGLGTDGKLRIAAFADYQARSLLDGADRQWTKWAASGTAIETAMTEAERFSGLAENQTRGAMTEIHLGGGDLGVALQAGAVSESDAMLSGTAGDENLRGLRSRTAFAGLSGAADLFGSGWRLRGSAHLGRSWAESESMLRDGDLWASAFSAGLERGGWLYSDDGFVLRFSQPLRVESLEMELIGEGGAGRLGAEPSGRQLDVDAAYRLPLSGGGWLLLSAGVRRDGGHTSSSDLEAGALFSVERGF